MKPQYKENTFSKKRAFKLSAVAVALMSSPFAAHALSLSETGSAGDKVWYDSNADGLQDDGEAGVPQVTLSLRSCDGDIELQSTSTDSSGNYNFSYIDPSSSVRVVLYPDTNYSYTGAKASPKKAGSNTLIDNDGSNLASDENQVASDCFTVKAGLKTNGLDFGIYLEDSEPGAGSPSNGEEEKPPTLPDPTPEPVVPAKIGDTVFVDTNGDGIFGTGEAGVSGAIVTVYDGDNSKVSETTTDSKGSFLLEVPAGCYRIEMTLPGSFDQSTVLFEKEQNVCVEAGDVKLNVDYALTPKQEPTNATIGDRVFYNLDDEPGYGVGDSGLYGGIVKVYDETTNKLVATETTDKDGHFSVEVPKGCYRIELELPSSIDPSTVSYTSTQSGICVDNGEVNNDVDFSISKVTPPAANNSWDIPQPFQCQMSLFVTYHHRTGQTSVYAKPMYAAGYANPSWNYENYNYYINDNLAVTGRFDQEKGAYKTLQMPLLIPTSAESNAKSWAQTSYPYTRWVGLYYARDILDKSLTHFTNHMTSNTLTVRGFVNLKGDLGALTPVAETIAAMMNGPSVTTRTFREIYGQIYGVSYQSNSAAKIELTAIDDNGVESNRVECMGHVHVVQDINSPIALDMNGDGRIGVTGETTARDGHRASTNMTVEFDYGQGAVKSEWFAGDGDAILVDNRDGNAAASMSGARLFGDQLGKFEHGYEQLAQWDRNGDKVVSGAELEGLALWYDNGDAVVQQSELVSASEAGVWSLSTNMALTKGMMRSTAIVDGQRVMTEDVWFATAPLAAAAPAGAPVAELASAGASKSLLALMAGLLLATFAGVGTRLRLKRKTTTAA